MATLDLNALQEPTLDVTLRDEARTVIHITYPDVDLFEALTAFDAPSLTSGDGASLQLNYTLLAQIMNHNLDGITVTAEELRDKYRVTLYMATQIYVKYLEFVSLATNEKN
jgi:hypothetical protein